MQSLMLDIETLGTKAGCIVLSIGAVEFDNDGLGKEFEVVIDVESAVKAGLVIEPRTVMWWMEQSDEARKKITAPGVDLLTALGQFKDAFDWKGKQVWCNGANFDFPILEAAFGCFDAPTPWLFYNTNDYRTMKNLVGKKLVGDIQKAHGEVFTKHGALDDAKSQALTLIGILKHLRGE